MKKIYDIVYVILTCLVFAEIITEFINPLVTNSSASFFLILIAWSIYTIYLLFNINIRNSTYNIYFTCSLAIFLSSDINSVNINMLIKSLAFIFLVTGINELMKVNRMK